MPEMDNALAQSSEDNKTPCWTSFQQIVYDTAKASLSKHEKKRQDWVDPNDQMLRHLLAKRDQAHQRVLQIRSTRSAVEAYKYACRILQKAEELQRNLKSSDGLETFTDSKSVMERWSEYYQKLLYVPGDIEPEVLENIQKHSINTALDEKPTMDEVVRAIKGIKEGIAPGGDGNPAEV